MTRTVEITIDGTEYTVACDFAVVERIEQRFDLMSFLREIQAYRTKIKNVAWVLHAGLLSADAKLTYNEVGEWARLNLEEATAAASKIVTAILNAGPEKQSPASKKK